MKQQIADLKAFAAHPNVGAYWKMWAEGKFAALEAICDMALRAGDLEIQYHNMIEQRNLWKDSAADASTALAQAREALKLYEQMTSDCQAVLTRHLTAIPSSEERTVNALLGILDGPQWRAARNAALAEAKPHTVKAAAADLLERTAQLLAHRACCGTEHDPLNGKLHGYCVVCGVLWPCTYAGSPLASVDVPPNSLKEGTL